MVALIRTLILTLGFILLQPTYIFAQTYLEITQDTISRERYPHTTSSSRTFLSVGRNDPFRFQKTRTYMDIDRSEIDSITDLSSELTIYFDLYQYYRTYQLSDRYSYDIDQTDFQVALVSDQIPISDISWDHTPQQMGVTTTATHRNVGGWKEFDISEIYQYAYEQDIPNMRLEISMQDEAYPAVLFYSKECIGGTYLLGETCPDLSYTPRVRVESTDGSAVIETTTDAIATDRKDQVALTTDISRAQSYRFIFLDEDNKEIYASDWSPSQVTTPDFAYNGRLTVYGEVRTDSNSVFKTDRIDVEYIDLPSLVPHLAPELDVSPTIEASTTEYTLLDQTSSENRTFQAARDLREYVELNCSHDYTITAQLSRNGSKTQTSNEVEIESSCSENQPGDNSEVIDEKQENDGAQDEVKGVDQGPADNKSDTPSVKVSKPCKIRNRNILCRSGGILSLRYEHTTGKLIGDLDHMSPSIEIEASVVDYCKLQERKIDYIICLAQEYIRGRDIIKLYIDVGKRPLIEDIRVRGLPDLDFQQNKTTFHVNTDADLDLKPISIDTTLWIAGIDEPVTYTLYSTIPKKLTAEPTKPFRFPFSKHADVTQWHGNTAYQSPHTGIDFNVKKEPVLAIGDGTVRSVGWDSYLGPCNSGGNFINIAHADGMHSVYMHLEDSKEHRFTKGEIVKQGEVIGISGNSGSFNCNKLGYHLHLEVWDGPTQSDHTDPVSRISYNWDKVLSIGDPNAKSGDNPHPDY